MRENKHGAGCDSAWNKVWWSVPHPSLPARVCVCVAESESLTTPVVADARTLLSKWHGYSYLPIQSLLQPLQDLLLTSRVTDGETEARRGKHRSLFFASWTGIGQLRVCGADSPGDTEGADTQPRAWSWGTRGWTSTESLCPPHVANQIQPPESLHLLAGPRKTACQCQSYQVLSSFYWQIYFYLS